MPKITVKPSTVAALEGHALGLFFDNSRPAPNGLRDIDLSDETHRNLFRIKAEGESVDDCILRMMDALKGRPN